MNGGLLDEETHGEDKGHHDQIIGKVTKRFVEGALEELWANSTLKIIKRERRAIHRLALQMSLSSEKRLGDNLRGLRVDLRLAQRHDGKL
jgi:hypothetical protein